MTGKTLVRFYYLGATIAETPMSYVPQPGMDMAIECRLLTDDSWDLVAPVRASRSWLPFRVTRVVGSTEVDALGLNIVTAVVDLATDLSWTFGNREEE